MKIAFFITSHGFGHASRSSAVLNALSEKMPDTHFEIYTGTPEWLFLDSFVKNFSFHPGAVDIGLVQTRPMEHDLPATIRAVTGYLDTLNEKAEKLACELRETGVDAVYCDISPLGILAGKKAGKPVFLFENFTWDWIYEMYRETNPEFYRINERLAEIFSLADYRLQSEPLCDPIPEADILIPPVSRKPHHNTGMIREKLGISPEERIGMVSMGGIPENLEFVINRPIPDEVVLLLPGTFDRIERVGNKILLPHRSGIYHPDMIHSVEFVIGKAGYSTIAEVCASGAAYGYISREGFRESEVTSAFLRKRTNTMEIDHERFESFTLEDEICQLLDMGKVDPQPVNGSDITADFILQKLRAA